MAPLYKITQGKNFHYLLDDSELEAYREKNSNKKFEVNYFKGLGEMNPDELRHTTLDPQKRRMKQVTMTDESIVAKVFSDLMGTSVSPRKRFIEENADKANVAI